MEKNKEEKETLVSLDTMTYVGKKVTIAGREYEVAPVNIRDMHYIIGEDDNRLLILDKDKVESGEISWQVFGINVVDEEKKKVFFKMLNKYVKYNDKPMTEELVVEHNWSFKEIGEFLFAWCQISE